MPASSFHSLLSQFQARYPMGCLSAELLTIHQEQYVIRAVIQMGSLTLATAMATDSNLEMAEDRAKLRVLETVVLETVVLEQPIGQSQVKPEPVFIAPVQPLPVESFESLPALPQPMFSATFGTESASAESAPEPFFPVAASATSASADQPSWEAEFQAVTQLSPTAVEEPAATEPVKASVTSGLRTSKSERASKRPAEPVQEQPVEQPIGQSVAEPADRSEEIMRIGIEMKRLGWSTEQGREYLKRTYGKASRSKLDDAELLDFLHYLEMQSSPLQTQTPF